MRIILGLVITLSILGSFHCNEYEDEEAKELAQALDIFSDYEDYFQNKDEFKKGMNEGLQKLKDEIKQEKEKAESDETLEDELDEGYVEAENELDLLFADYNDDLAGFVNENSMDIEEDKKMVDEIFENGLNDEFEEAEKELDEEQKMYEETKNEINLYLEKDYTEGEGKQLIEDTIAESKKEIEEEIPEYLDEYYEVEEEAEQVFDKAVVQFKEEHAGDAEAIEDIEEIENSEAVQDAEKIDQVITEELNDFDVDVYLADPNANEYEEEAKQFLRDELEESEELQSMGIDEAKKTIEKVKAKWEKEGNEKYLKNKETFNQWFNEAMNTFKDPASEQKKYDEAKELLKSKWQEVKGKVAKKAKKEEMDFLKELDEELDATSVEDLDAMVDEYSQEFEEIEAGNFDSYMESPPQKAKKFLSKMAKKIRKHK